VRLFGRRGGQGRPEDSAQVDELDEPGVQEGDEAGFEDDAEFEDDAPRPLSPRPEGPWDVSERASAEGYVDLGALRLRGRNGMELRLDVEEASGSVTAATVHMGDSAVQLQAFAAPRSEGIWADIREEIAESIISQGGAATEQIGVFGPELLARIPMRSADGRSGHQPSRFTGIDGPRWFLRAVFHGAAVSDAEAAAELEAVVRDIVVVRGEEAMAPRELLTLQLPTEVTTALNEGEGEDGENAPFRDDLDPFERGPEITEVR